MLSKDQHSSTSEDNRVSALHGYNILDTPSEYQFDNIAKLASLVCNAPIALIALVDENRVWFKSSIGITFNEIPRGISFCEYTIISENNDVFEVYDALVDDRFKNHPSVIDPPYVRSYAGASLIDENGFKLGTVCVFDTVPRQFTSAQKEGLQTLAKEVMTHISLQRKSEELAAHAQRFEELLNISAVSPEIHCILDNAGKVLFVNKAITHLLEYSVEEATGLNIWGFCHREDLSRVVNTIEDGLRKGIKQFEIDFRIVSKTGIVRWISWTMVAKNARWYAYGRDITENKKVEHELMKLSFVASKINNAVVINDANNHVTWVNEAFEKITGFNLNDLKGKRLGDLISGPKTDMELLEKARELTRKNKSFTVDLLAYRKDKQPIWISIYNTVVFNEEGKVEIEVEIIIDITDKKNAEEDLQVLSLVASETNTGVNISDANCYTTWVNQSLERLTGYASSELLGFRLGDVLCAESDVAQQQLINEAREKAQNKQPYSIEVQAKKKDGTMVWLSVATTPVVGDTGKLERQIDLITDITQRKQVEQEMVDAKEQALQLSEAKEMFLSVMSHEIRTPLNAVIGMTHLLMDNDPKPSQIEDLNILKFSGENLLNIINDILDFTKIETGNLHLESMPFSMKGLTTDIVTSLSINANKRGNELVLLYDDEIPKLVSGDKTRLYQVLMNLLGNAIKFTDHGKIILQLKLISNDDERIAIHFEVSDDGIGIPEDKLNYIFEAFTQAKTDISRKYGGTGLGLAITKKLLQLYKSEIEVKSIEGEGTCFSFTLNFLKSTLLANGGELIAQPEAFTGKRILIVDDNEINLLIAKRILGKFGVNIDFALSGEEAILKVKDERYDLVFMDIKMPGMDGFETTRIIRSQPDSYFKMVPIIALTASTLQNEYRKFKESGMNGHILKPFKPEEVRELLSIHLYQ
ncbi:PAS domain S-box-containing protein [Pedobacter sp. ok626]|uniref:PAS domain S-box protein n=1 Tax=Pedobacter sp. ok626 TaxID=1761882 RepID=UPI00087EB9CC|nr:PAS domain S-box protein [Pedobacter sp. ok626]SDJ30439.1 PAS domain S-box-containing protein [Pedobacter sp. ok626]